MTLAGFLYIGGVAVAIVLVAIGLSALAYYISGLTDEEKESMHIVTDYKKP